MWWEFIKAAFLFGLVLVLVWATTRFVGLRMGPPVRGRLLRVLEHIPAGRDRSIMLLEVAGRVYLVGATAERINLLEAIDDPDTIRRLLENIPAQVEHPLGIAVPGTFAEILAKVRAYIPGQPVRPMASGSETDDDETDHLKQQIERLRRLHKKE